MLDTDEVLNAARAAKAAGSTRFCMGAAWRDLAGRKSNFKKIVGFVKEIRYSCLLFLPTQIKICSPRTFRSQS